MMCDRTLSGRYEQILPPKCIAHVLLFVNLKDMARCYFLLVRAEIGVNFAALLGLVTPGECAEGAECATRGHRGYRINPREFG